MTVKRLSAAAGPCAMPSAPLSSGTRNTPPPSPRSAPRAPDAVAAANTTRTERLSVTGRASRRCTPAAPAPPPVAAKRQSRRRISSANTAITLMVGIETSSAHAASARGPTRRARSARARGRRSAGPSRSRSAARDNHRRARQMLKPFDRGRMSSQEQYWTATPPSSTASRSFSPLTGARAS